MRRILVCDEAEVNLFYSSKRNKFFSWFRRVKKENKLKPQKWFHAFGVGKEKENNKKGSVRCKKKRAKKILTRRKQ